MQHLRSVDLNHHQIEFIGTVCLSLSLARSLTKITFFSLRYAMISDQMSIYHRSECRPRIESFCEEEGEGDCVCSKTHTKRIHMYENEFIELVVIVLAGLY